MSQNNKSSRRKTKLMTRDDSDMEYENISDLEEPANMRIPKIKIELLPDAPTEASLSGAEPEMPVPQFSIKVEVEEFESAVTVKNEYDSEGELVIDETDYTALSKKLDEKDPCDITEQNDVTLERSAKSSVKSNLTSKTGNKNKNCGKRKRKKTKSKTKKKKSPTKEKTVYNIMSSSENLNVVFRVDDHFLNEIFLEADKILQSTCNTIDKALAIEVKNAWGRIVFKEANKTPIETLLSKTLDRWHTMSRQAPLFYKCYICNKSWWYLYPFRQHLAIHDLDTLRLSIEDVFRECNVIAYENSAPRMRDVETEGNCYRCNKSYEVHKTSTRTKSMIYYCVECHMSFGLCSELKDHESGCRAYMRKFLGQFNFEIFQCSLCLFSFFTKKELVDHMVVTHSVRSDIPVAIKTSFCKQCSRRYVVCSLHPCQPQFFHHQCRYCERPFFSQTITEVHENCTSGDFPCHICDVILEKECMIPMHYVTHSHAFTMVYRCCLCKDSTVFLDDYSIERHCKKEHSHLKMIIQYERVIIPKACIKEMDDSNTDNEDKEENEIMTKSELALALNNLSQQLPVVPNVVRSRLNHNSTISKRDQASAETSTAVNAIQDASLNEVVEIKQEMVEVKEEMPQFYVMEEDNADSEMHEEYENVLSHMLHPSPSVTQWTPDIKSEPDEDYYDDDIIQLHMSLCSNQDTGNRETEDCGTGSSSTSTSTPTESESNTKRTSYRNPKLYTCAKCGYKNYHKEYSIHINSNCKINPRSLGIYKYLCTKCGKSYTTLKKYIEHYQQHGLKYLTCPICKETSSCIVKLVAHLQSHIKSIFLSVLSIDHNNITKRSKREFQCKDCKKMVAEECFFSHWESHLVFSDENVTATQDIVKTDLGRMDCDRALGHTVLKKVTAHLLHQTRIKIEISKTCDVCHKTFDRKNDCKRHLIEHLLIDAWLMKPKYGGLRCQICGEVIRKPDGYKQHMRAHGSLPVYACRLCQRTFSDSSNFAKHRKVHNQNAFLCDICNRKFQVKVSLVKHMEVHMTTKPVQCPVCQKMCYTASAYKKHQRFHDKTNRNFACHICNIKFHTLKDKWDHMWLEHKERKYNADCQICTKKFRKFQDLKRHVKDDHNMAVMNAKASGEKDIERFLQRTCSLQQLAESSMAYD